MLRSKASGVGSAKLKSGLFAECGLVCDASDGGAVDAQVGQFATGQGLQFGDCFAVQGTFGHLLTQSGPARYDRSAERRGGYIEICYYCHRSILYINRSVDALYVERVAKFRNACLGIAAMQHLHGSRGIARLGLHQGICAGIAAQRIEESLDANRPF